MSQSGKWNGIRNGILDSLNCTFEIKFSKNSFWED